MRAFVTPSAQQGLRPRLWFAPLAADPGSDVLHDHADMLLLDEWGGFQTVSWWNSLTQCPAYQPTIDYYVGADPEDRRRMGIRGTEARRSASEFGRTLLQPAHRHAHPNESVEKLP